MGHEEHRGLAPADIACAVLTISDTRTEDTDSSGALIREILAAAGHGVADYRIIPDDRVAIRRAVAELVGQEKVQAIILTGGTGITTRDVTIEALESLLDKTLDGFGELFRYLSFQEIGPAAMLSRAAAGTCQGVLIFAIPGSAGAARLALEKLIAPEMGHMVAMAADIGK